MVLAVSADFSVSTARAGEKCLLVFVCVRTVRKSARCGGTSFWNCCPVSVWFFWFASMYRVYGFPWVSVSFKGMANALYVTEFESHRYSRSKFVGSGWVEKSVENTRVWLGVCCHCWYFGDICSVARKVVTCCVSQGVFFVYSESVVGFLK